ncbi:serine hydrolase [Pseudohalocynthiibacter aestuariivivens]|nr:serine hydrolase [Pseudohalocynthiibacter aestuariivivens]QIE44919.1 serine hydrolase [Pseudohalocynthiibacter aestuariivivens]
MPPPALARTQQNPRSARDLGIMRGFPPPPEKRPTLENWDLAPFNRWSFQNIRSLFPTADVWHGTAPVRPFHSDLQDLDTITFTAQDGSTKSVRDWLTSSYTDGFLIMHRGHVITESYFNDMRRQTPHLSQSVGKSIVGALVGVLHGEGKVDLDAPLADIVPELAQCGYATATLNQVLDMRSGVRFTEDYGMAGSDMTQIDIASGWRPPAYGEVVPTIRDVILTLPQERDHGEAFKYRSIETDLLAWVLERVSGQSLATLLSERIWSRLGCERDGFFTVDSAGTALADGGFNATLRDYARFGLMMLSGGRVGDVQVVPETWVEDSRTGDPDVFGAPYTIASPNGAYSRQWWIHDAKRRDFMARGVFGQLIYLDPETDFMAVKLSSWPDYLIESFTVDMLAAVTAIRDTLSA